MTRFSRLDGLDGIIRSFPLSVGFTHISKNMMHEGLRCHDFMRLRQGALWRTVKLEKGVRGLISLGVEAHLPKSVLLSRIKCDSLSHPVKAA